MHGVLKLIPTRFGRFLLCIFPLVCAISWWPTFGKYVGSQQIAKPVTTTRVGVVVVGADALRERLVSLKPALISEFHRFGQAVELVLLSCERSDAECVSRQVSAAARTGVNVFIALSTHTSQQVKAIAGIQGVFTSRADPVQFGLVDTYVRPGGSMTGVYLGDTLHHRRMQLLRQTVRAGAKIGVIADHDWVANADHLDFVRSAALAEGVEINYFAVDTNQEVDSLSVRVRSMDALYFPVSLSTTIFGERLVAIAKQNKKPAIFASRKLFDAGAAMSYHFDETAVDSQLAAMARKLVGGEKAGDLPTESPKRVEFAIDLDLLASTVSPVPPVLLFASDLTR